MKKWFAPLLMSFCILWSIWYVKTHYILIKKRPIGAVVELSKNMGMDVRVEGNWTVRKLTQEQVEDMFSFYGRKVIVYKLGFDGQPNCGFTFYDESRLADFWVEIEKEEE